MNSHHQSGKHDELDQAQLDQYSVNSLVAYKIEQYQLTQNLDSSSVKILDWGCGRGRMVLKLKQRGYDCYGVDLDPAPLAKVGRLAKSMGYKPSEMLRVLENGNCPFPDSYFDIIITNQVFEHIENLHQVGHEMARVTKPGGLGLHCYPAHHVIVEPHLKMPIVHWLPKNFVRKSMIRVFLTLGADPGWREVNHLSSRERAQIYYQYSVGKTFYRSPKIVQEIFTRLGFRVSFVATQSPRIELLLNRFRLKNIKFVRRMIEIASSHFKSVWISLDHIGR